MRGIPAAVTYSGRAEVPRSAGTAWVAVRKADLATPITGTANSAPGPGAGAGPAVRVQIGEAVDHEQGHPGQAVKRCAQRRELAQVEPAWPVGPDVRHQFNAVSQQAEEAGIGRHGSRRPGAARCQVVDVRGHEHASVRAPASCHVPSMPGPGDNRATAKPKVVAAYVSAPRSVNIS